MPTALAHAGKAAPPATDGPPAIVSAPRLAPTEAARRWAARLQQIFAVDPLAGPTCHGPVRFIAFITQASLIDKILVTPARWRHTGARAPVLARQGTGASTQPSPIEIPIPTTD